ncbi:MAG: phenylalanine--tRNA ligase subunit beta [Candidatus Aenigmatarchaeota archaeon]
MKFRIKDLKQYLVGEIDWVKIARQLTEKSFESVFVRDKYPYLDVDILPNRYASLASFVGLAKEIEILSGFRFKEPKYKIKEFNLKPKLKVITQKDLAPFYFGRLILNLKNRPSPEWLRELVEFYGFNSNNFLVDLANFVMIEYGAPLHIFDLDRVKGDIRVRLAKKGERFISLENKEFLLEGEEIVITDEEKILALAGIKGSKFAEVTLETRNIFIEAAIFDPKRIYQTSRKLNLKTEASFRFERKVAPIRSRWAIDRLAYLIYKSLGGKILKGVIGDKNLKEKKLVLNLDKLTRFTGLNFSKKEIIGILKKLGIEVDERLPTKLIKEKDKLILTKIPLDRLDLISEEDIIEEVIRIYNLNKIKPIYEPSVREIFIDERIEFNNLLREIMTKIGYNEVYNYSFFSDKDFNLVKSIFEDKKLIEVLNPLSENYKYFRISLIPNLIKSVHLNQFEFKELRIFEIGKVGYFDEKILVRSNQFEKSIPFSIKEEYHLGVCCSYKDEEFIFRELKGVLSLLLNELGVNFDLYEIQKNKFFDVIAGIKFKNRKIGFLLLLSHEALEEFDIDLNVGILELNLEEVRKLANLKKTFKPWPTFPPVIRDLSFFVKRKIKFADLEKEIKNLRVNFLKEIRLIDIYYPNLKTEILKDHLDEAFDEKSMTLRFIFYHPERSLTADEVNGSLKVIENFLKRKFEVKIR